MRILLVTDEFGRPENTGYRKRVANIVRTLADMGDLAWVVLARSDPTGLGAPPDVAITPQVVEAHLRPRPVGLARWVISRNPWRYDAVALRSTQRALAQALAGQGPIDLVFVTRVDTAELVRPLLSPLLTSTTVLAIDIDDIESSKIAHRLATMRSHTGVRAAVRRAVLGTDCRRWARLEAATVARAVTFVCSSLDRDRLGGRPELLANGVAPPPPGYEHQAHPASPTMIFVGSLDYDPNVDAIEFAINEVLPLIRREVPEALLRIVGRGAGERVRMLAAQPGVELVGEVDDVAPELATATLTLVPLRFGGGTRVKILEAFAHQVPVVTTTVGAEGLEVTDDVHCLVADDAAALAASCIGILRDPTRGAAHAAAGTALCAHPRHRRFDGDRAERLLGESEPRIDCAGQRRRLDRRHLHLHRPGWKMGQ